MSNCKKKKSIIQLAERWLLAEILIDGNNRSKSYGNFLNGIIYASLYLAFKS